MNEIILNRIKQESEGDTRKYLINCHYNYSEYVQATKILFPYYYQNINKFIEAEKDYNKSLELRKEGDFNGELEILISIISKGCSAPGIYIRAATMFKSKKEFQKAKELILKWFEGEFWKLPNMCVGSLKLLDMLEGLDNKL